MDIKVRYIYHSGFIVEYNNISFIFDYYKGDIPKLCDNVVVFSSHNHRDHFNPSIMELKKKYKNVTYVLSNDIKGYDCISVKGNMVYNIIVDNNNLKIETFNSTDEGVAFLITYNDLSIFHAGDLNLWCWEEEGIEYVNKMEKDFYEYTKPLKGRKVDVAFYLLDYRLDNRCYDGIIAFNKLIDAKYIFPMHMWDRYDLIGKCNKDININLLDIGKNNLFILKKE